MGNDKGDQQTHNKAKRSGEICLDSLFCQVSHLRKAGNSMNILEMLHSLLLTPNLYSLPSDCVQVRD